jgi:hypothetical protein
VGARPGAAASEDLVRSGTTAEADPPDSIPAQTRRVDQHHVLAVAASDVGYGFLISERETIPPSRPRCARPFPPPAKDWAKDRARRRKTGVPKEIRFKTKPQIAPPLDPSPRWRFQRLARGTGSGLDDACYAELVKPITDVPLTTFRSVEPTLFERDLGSGRVLRRTMLRRRNMNGDSARSSAAARFFGLTNAATGTP